MKQGPDVHENSITCIKTGLTINFTDIINLTNTTPQAIVDPTEQKYEERTRNYALSHCLAEINKQRWKTP